MNAPAPSIAATVRDAGWLPHRYDESRDAIRFVTAPRERRRDTPFLTDEYLDTAAPRVVARRDALAAAPTPAPIHFVFHSAYCCSTLFARAFDVTGLASPLKEPQILNDLVGWRRRGAAPAHVAEVLDGSLALLARPFAAGEACVVKPSNIVNTLAVAMLAMRPQAGALLLHAPLDTFLASIAKKGLWGRLWVRELFEGQLIDAMIGLGFEPREHLRHTDLQIAALGWLAQHRLFAQLVARYGAARVATLDSATLLARPQEAVAAYARLCRMPLDAPTARAIAEGPAFRQHSKFGDAFAADDRAAEHRAAADAHADEIAKVMVWAQAVAEANGIAMTLPAPLLP